MSCIRITKNAQRFGRDSMNMMEEYNKIGHQNTKQNTELVNWNLHICVDFTGIDRIESVTNAIWCESRLKFELIQLIEPIDRLNG